jgi:hypothetical protein
VKIFKHQTIQRQPNVPTIVGGYSAAAMQAGVSSYQCCGSMTFWCGSGFKGKKSNEVIKTVEIKLFLTIFAY